jgi:diguanylate cyclase (GGDEF)-like protein
MSRAPFAFGLKSGVSSPPSYHLPARAAKADRRESENARPAARVGPLVNFSVAVADRGKTVTHDTLGHAAGDDALRSTAHIVERSIRHIDLASRYGGEEFVVALIGTDAAGAADVAERIRRRVHETKISSSPEQLSVSIGVATFPTDAHTKEELLDKAVWAMHVAKRLGRNRVVAFSPTGPALA